MGCGGDYSVMSAEQREGPVTHKACKAVRGARGKGFTNGFLVAPGAESDWDDGSNRLHANGWSRPIPIIGFRGLERRQREAFANGSGGA